VPAIGEQPGRVTDPSVQAAKTCSTRSVLQDRLQNGRKEIRKATAPCKEGMASRAKEGNINMLEISQKKKSKEYHFIVKTKSYAQVLGCMDLAASALIACIVINQQSSTTYGATKIEESINMLILVSSRTYALCSIKTASQHSTTPASY
jgi:hypothetical protein